MDLFQVISNLQDSIFLFLVLSLAFLFVFAIALLASNLLLMKKHGVYLLYCLGLFIALAVIAAFSSSSDMETSTVRRPLPSRWISFTRCICTVTA